MTELKTLKDFLESNYRKDIGAICVMKDLKTKAIKWVKYDRLNYEIRWGSAAHQIINNWIKRFNLTEEDLK